MKWKNSKNEEDNSLYAKNLKPMSKVSAYSTKEEDQVGFSTMNFFYGVTFPLQVSKNK